MQEKKNKIQEYMNEENVEYALWAAGALLFIYVGGIVMKLVGRTANSFKYMSNAFKK
jgi:hypothetical protein